MVFVNHESSSSSLVTDLQQGGCPSTSVLCWCSQVVSVGFFRPRVPARKSVAELIRLSSVRAASSRPPCIPPAWVKGGRPRHARPKPVAPCWARRKGCYRARSQTCCLSALRAPNVRNHLLRLPSRPTLVTYMGVCSCGRKDKYGTLALQSDRCGESAG